MVLLDVVNDKDEVIDSREFLEVYASLKTDKPMMHRSVHIFVFNSQGKLLLQRRAKNMIIAPDKWDSSSAGHVDAGDSYEKTAIKELHEEIGIDVSSEDIVCLQKFAPDGGLYNQFCTLFLCEHDGPFTANEEVDDLKLLSIEEIIEDLKIKPDEYTLSFKKYFTFYLNWLLLQQRRSLTDL